MSDLPAAQRPNLAARAARSLEGLARDLCRAPARHDDWHDKNPDSVEDGVNDDTDQEILGECK